MKKDGGGLLTGEGKAKASRERVKREFGFRAEDRGVVLLPNDTNEES